MTYSIFFDLETSDLNFMGQILNFSFIVVDSEWNIVDELNGEIKLSRLQLPRARAILANQINVLEHQQRAKYTEATAMSRIVEFLQDCLDNSGVSTGQLIGYNSGSFDLPYLRTSLIRNGYNPYFKIQNRDLLLVAQKLWISYPEFRKKIIDYADQNSLPANLKLETLCKAHNLLEGKQSHESREDVILTIELAKTFLQLYGLDVRTFDPYEGRSLHRMPRGSVFSVATGIYKLETQISHFTLLQAEPKSALWIDLDKFKECQEQGLELKSAVRWIKFEGKIFVTDGQEVHDATYHELAKQALVALKDLQISNFFEETTCDIEQFIYRIPFNSFPMLAKFMQDPKGSAQLSADEKELVKRYRLANYQLGSGDDQKISQALKEYAEYRYLGRAQLANTSKSTWEDSEHRKDFHPTLIELIAEIDQVANESAENLPLMEALGKFYRGSEIFQQLLDKD